MGKVNLLSLDGVLDGEMDAGPSHRRSASGHSCNDQGHHLWNRLDQVFRAYKWSSHHWKRRLDCLQRNGSILFYPPQAPNHSCNQILEFGKKKNRKATNKRGVRISIGGYSYGLFDTNDYTTVYIYFSSFSKIVLIWWTVEQDILCIIPIYECFSIGFLYCQNKMGHLGETCGDNLDRN